MRWIDNKAVQLASNYIRTELGNKLKRWSCQDKKRIDVECPTMVHQYNNFMVGVDLNDMLLSLYRIRLRSKKWYWPIIVYCIKLAVTNSWLLYRRHSMLIQPGKRHKLFLLQFQAEIAYSLSTIGKVTKKVQEHKKTWSSIITTVGFSNNTITQNF